MHYRVLVITVIFYLTKCQGVFLKSDDCTQRVEESETKIDILQEKYDFLLNPDLHEYITQKADRNNAIVSTDHALSTPTAYTTPLDETLCDHVIQLSPCEIQNIVKLWKPLIGIDRHSPAMKEYYKGIKKKWLLIGPSGTGKTTIAKAIAGICAIPFFLYKASVIGNVYKNSATKNLESIFKDAANLHQPVIIILDELEAFLKQHNNINDSDGGVLTALWQLLDEYEDHPILFIATLNNATESPDPIKNRFQGCSITIPLPSEQVRREVIAYHMQNLCNQVDETLARALAQKTHGFAHRNLQSMVSEVRSKHRINGGEITPHDYWQALKFEQKHVIQRSNIWRRFNKAAQEWAPTIGVIGVAIGIFNIILSMKSSKQQITMQLAIHKENIAFQQKWQKQSTILQEKFHDDNLHMQSASQDISKTSLLMQATPYISKIFGPLVKIIIFD